MLVQHASQRSLRVVTSSTWELATMRDAQPSSQGLTSHKGSRKVDIDKNTPRYLGAAFLIQAVASGASGLLLTPVDLLAASVSGNIAEVMTTIANNSFMMRASIVGEMVTAFGVTLLGVLLFVTLKKQSGIIALVALALYLIEVALLAFRETLVFSLLRISQESVAAGHPESLQTLGNLIFESQSLAYSLHTLFFAIGATMFYFLFYRSGYIPRILALWGVIAAPLALLGTLVELLGYRVPLVVFLPNLPFELTMGIWLLVRGIREQPDSS